MCTLSSPFPVSTGCHTPAQTATVIENNKYALLKNKQFHLRAVSLIALEVVSLQSVWRAEENLCEIQIAQCSRPRLPVASFHFRPHEPLRQANAGRASVLLV